MPPRPQHPPTRRTSQQPTSQLGLHQRHIGAYDLHRGATSGIQEGPPDATAKKLPGGLSRVQERAKPAKPAATTTTTSSTITPARGQTQRRSTDGPVISFDQMGPISLKPIQGAGWAIRRRPERLRATYNRKHGIRYIFGALDVHRDRLYARMRPRRAGSDVLGYMKTIRMVYPARQRIYWIQDNLSANWTPDIRAYAANNKIELVPTPTYASYLKPDREPLPPDPRVRVQQHRLRRLDHCPTRARGLHHPPQRPRPRPPDRRPRTQTPNRRMNPLPVKPSGWTH
jgi:hypothetical protein